MKDGEKSCLLFILSLFLLSSCASTNPRLKTLSYDDKLTYWSIEKIAAAQELDEFLGLNSDQRSEWLRQFWKRLDPTPTTERNEFKEEHDRRVDYVLTNFHTIFGHKPWDERGDVYIIYGEPDERDLNIEATTKDYKTQFEDENTKRDKREKFMDRKMGLIPLDTEEEFYKTCGEVWVYDRYNLIFQFEDRNFVGHYALVPYTRFDGTSEEAQELNVKRVDRIEKQREIYHHDYGGKSLEFALDLEKFRGETNDYNVDLNLGLPLDHVGRDDSNQVRLSRHIVVLDEKLNQVLGDSTVVSDRIDGSLGSGHLLVEQWQCNLLPGKYTLGVEIRDLNTKKVGTYKKEFLLPAYVFPGTQEISNIVMASSIRPARRYETKYLKHGLIVLPMPSRVYYPDEMIYFYYEVYNLKKDEKGKTRYAVHYSLVNYKDKKEMVFYEPKTFEEDKSDIFQHAKIDAYSVLPGEYALVIRVTDINRNKDKVTLTGFKIKEK